MKVLLVKMSSMGDVVHALPAVTDAAAHCEGIELDWVVEEAFAAIPAMHPAVRRVIEIAVRRWRRRPLASLAEFASFRRSLRREAYDVVIDAQGLLKSAGVTLLARGARVGLDWASAREPAASLAYGRKVSAAPGAHAVSKLRDLFAVALGYATPDSPADFGLGGPAPGERQPTRIMFLHGTTWRSKHWPESFWIELARIIRGVGVEVAIAHGDDEELARARRIAAAAPGARVLDRLDLAGLAAEMSRCSGIVTVDSGPGHLAAALGVPLVGLYGPTDPRLTGPTGALHRVLQGTAPSCIPCLRRDCKYAGTLPAGSVEPPCFAESTPLRVWQALQALTASASP